MNCITTGNWHNCLTRWMNYKQMRRCMVTRWLNIYKFHSRCNQGRDKILIWLYKQDTHNVVNRNLGVGGGDCMDTSQEWGNQKGINWPQLEMLHASPFNLPPPPTPLHCTRPERCRGWWTWGGSNDGHIIAEVRADGTGELATHGEVMYSQNTSDCQRPWWFMSN